MRGCQIAGPRNSRIIVELRCVGRIDENLKRKSPPRLFFPIFQESTDSCASGREGDGFNDQVKRGMWLLADRSNPFAVNSLRAWDFLLRALLARA